MRIRPAGTEDVPEVVGLERSVFGADAWSEDSVREEVAGERRRAVVALAEDGSLAGYAVTLRGDDVVDLVRIAVRPEERRRGLARALLGHLRTAARAEGANRMLLEVGARNEAALAFYAAEGFVQIDRRARYYRDGSDALVLRATLGGPACGGEA